VKGYLLSIIVGIAVGAVGTRYYDAHRLTAKPADAPKTVTDEKPVEVLNIDFTQQPLWAYGFEQPPAPGEKARPQAPPNRNLRPNEDPEETDEASAPRWKRGYLFACRYS
jgi:hypothetical protein